jgi:uncharacterized membrane protein
MSDREPTVRRLPPGWGRAVWAGTLLLVLTGVAAAIHRGVFIPDAITRADPARTRLYDRLHLANPLRSQRPAEVARMDAKFADHPLLTLLHVIAGGLFLAFAPLQFVARIRTRHPRLHRISGRLLVIAAFAGTPPAFYFGVVVPYGGPVEAAAIGLFGALFLVSLIIAVRAIRRGMAAVHREWMIRAFALALAISTVRLLGLLIDPICSPMGFHPAPLFAATVWSGWLLTLGAAEFWIHHTRLRLSGNPGATTGQR